MQLSVNAAMGIVAYMALFTGVGLVFLFVNLLVGRFVRPFNPHSEKLDIYECGEPTIGSGFVQFDLRFYVIALLFIIFDVEVAFFFPWAAVFGKSMHFTDQRLAVVQTEKSGDVKLSSSAIGLYRELGVRHPTLAKEVPPSLINDEKVKAANTAAARSEAVIREGSRQLAWVTIVDIVVFFAVLMIGFAYVWKRGDLDWVRAVSRERAAGRNLRARTGDPLGEEAGEAAVAV